MRLIADSGSTKTDWRLIDDENKIHQYGTDGLNPYFHGTEAISKVLKEQLIPSIKSEIRLSRLTRGNPSVRTLRRSPFGPSEKSEIFFYGAGCSNIEQCEIIKSALKENFENSKIEVHHDLLGAARALCGQEKGIAAILGTGSNSCYYDGKNIVENIPALGYILGDEGSGAYLGKKFLQAYLNNELPKEIYEKFNKNFQLSKDDILTAVYNLPNPNRFLASFSKFLFQNLKHPYIAKLVYSAFEDFFDKHICKYREHKEVKMSCVGSVGFYFSKILKNVASDKGVAIDKIIKAPIAALTLYHI